MWSQYVEIDHVEVEVRSVDRSQDSNVPVPARGAGGGLYRGATDMTGSGSRGPCKTTRDVNHEHGNKSVERGCRARHKNFVRATLLSENVLGM